MKAGMTAKGEGGGIRGLSGTPPMFVMLTEFDPGAVAEFVVNVVLVVLVGVAKIPPSAVFAWPYVRIVIALPEVAIASEATAASARVRSEATFMKTLLKCCRKPR